MIIVSIFLILIFLFIVAPLNIIKDPITKHIEDDIEKQLEKINEKY